MSIKTIAMCALVFVAGSSSTAFAKTEELGTSATKADTTVSPAVIKYGKGKFNATELNPQPLPPGPPPDKASSIKNSKQSKILSPSSAVRTNHGRTK